MAGESLLSGAGDEWEYSDELPLYLLFRGRSLLANGAPPSPSLLFGDLCNERMSGEIERDKFVDIVDTEWDDDEDIDLARFRDGSWRSGTSSSIRSLFRPRSRSCFARISSATPPLSNSIMSAHTYKHVS